MKPDTQLTDAQYLVQLCVAPQAASIAKPAADPAEPVQGMHPELIKAEIRMRGETPLGLARRLGVSGQCVSHVIHSRGISTPVAKLISEVTGIPIATLWPGKYLKPARSRYPSRSHATTPA